jgi:hypothetical protein
MVVAFDDPGLQLILSEVARGLLDHEVFLGKFEFHGMVS